MLDFFLLKIDLGRLPLLRCGAALVVAAGLCQCASKSSVRDADVVVSVPDQKLGYYRDGRLVESFKVSTSKFGIGDAPGSCRTPLGKHEVVAKIGHGLPKGAVLKSRQWNGEVLKPNAPGRDPVVSRIMWLSGLEKDNHNAQKRFIYIHGTTEEDRLGKPASYGCVRMAMGDVISLFNEVNVGAKVVITKDHLPKSEPVSIPVPENDKGMLAAQTKPVPAAAEQPVTSKSVPVSAEIPAASPPSTPGELHSGYEPAHPPHTPIKGERTSNGKQRLSLPVERSVSKTDEKKSKTKHEVTLKSSKKSGPTPTSKKHKTDNAA